MVPVGLIGKVWSFVSFLSFFLFLLVLGLLKGALICPIGGCIIAVGNSSVVIGLWPAHFLWTYYCVAKTKRLGLVQKILLLVALPLPLVLWPVLGIIVSLLGGIGYGFIAPLTATFEAAGGNIEDKLFHCFVGGCWSTIKGSGTVVRDFTDLCFHSYFSFMDELSEKVPENEKPMDIKLSKLPSCLLVSLIGLPVDVILITALALWKSPYMLFKGWKRLLEDLVGREGPFSEIAYVPFAGLSIILWPLAVAGAVIAAFISSFFLGLYGGFIVYQEDSIQLGFAYIVSAVSLFDEYANDLLYVREGSCLPRPRYRRNVSPCSEDLDRKKSTDGDSINQNIGKAGNGSKLVSDRSRTLKWAIQQYKPMQVWDWLFKSCEVNGRVLLRDGLIDIKDIEDCIVKGNCKKLSIKLPAWSVLQCLLVSAKSESSGLVISDEVELTRSNFPRDKVFEWFIGPLLVMKEQLKGLQLQVEEEVCLKKLVIGCDNDKPEEWDDSGFPSNDNVRRAQLQAIIRRVQGIVASLSRLPTFRRRFKNLVKVLYIEATGTGAIVTGGSLKAADGGKSLSIERKESKGSSGHVGSTQEYDNGSIV